MCTYFDPSREVVDDHPYVLFAGVVMQYTETVGDFPIVIGSKAE